LTALSGVAKRALPEPAYGWLRKVVQSARRLNPAGPRDFGRLDRVEPISRRFGLDRGTPIDRYYVEGFLHRYAGDVRGRVLEVGDDAYTRILGGDRVERRDILHAVAGNPKATIVGDLADPCTLPDSAFDCVICTQTLQFIFEVQAAVGSLCRALRPGGVLLATVPGISQISRYDMDRWGEHWRFTTQAVKALFHPYFDAASLEVVAYGNVYAAVSLLHGLAVEEITRENLDAQDPDYQVLIGARATRGAA
jgi:SAM-dependent methyltransferase